jgi:hypothetical protein
MLPDHPTATEVMLLVMAIHLSFIISVQMYLVFKKKGSM